MLSNSLEMIETLDWGGESVVDGVSSIRANQGVFLIYF
jgi:hypothetical protein